MVYQEPKCSAQLPLSASINLLACHLSIPMHEDAMSFPQMLWINLCESCFVSH